MIDQIRATNEAATKYKRAVQTAEEIFADFEKTELEIKKKNELLTELTADLMRFEQIKALRLEEWEKNLRLLKAAFSTQKRFEQAPSEEVQRAFSDEILPALDEVG
jgi:hypothetical protein